MGIKSLLYSCYYAEACNEWRGPSPRLSVWQHGSEETSQRRRAVGDTVPAPTATSEQLNQPADSEVAMLQQCNGDTLEVFTKYSVKNKIDSKGELKSIDTFTYKIRLK